MHDFKQYKATIEQLELQLADARHRQLVLITGSEKWCYALLNSVISSDDCMVLSTHAAF